MLSPKTLLVLVSVVGVVVFLFFLSKQRETFESENNAMNKAIKSYLQNHKSTSSNNNASKNTVARNDIEKAARAAAVQFCPVPPDYNPSQYIKKSEIEKEQNCPKMPDLKDYVLKSSIPPKQDCAPCICPKVNVMAEMCDKGDEEKLVCPSCEPCGYEQCKDVVECPSPDALSSEIVKENIMQYLQQLIADKEYRQLYAIKSLLKDLKTPQDDVLSLTEENNELKKQLDELKQELGRIKMGETVHKTKKSSGMMSNNVNVVNSSNNSNRKNNNSPVEDYAEKCENNRMNNWYNVSGIIGSPFNGLNK